MHNRASLLLSSALTGALIVAGASTPVWAQDASALSPVPTPDALTDTLDEITISASTVPVALSRTGTSVSVLTNADLQRAPLPVLSSLTTLPGVSFTRSGGLGTTATLRLRGLPGGYIGTRLDGLDITDPSGTTTAFDFGTLTGQGLSRIEVLRGSQSALYGANAVGGVVDMTSWRPVNDGSSGTVTLEGGSDKTWSGTASAGIKGERGEVALSTGRTITDGISAAAHDPERDGFQQNRATLYGAYDVLPNLRVGANGVYIASHSDIDGYDALTYLPGYSADTSDSTLRGGRVFAQFSTGDVSHELSIARTTTTRDSTDIAYADLYTYQGARTTFGYHGSWDMGAPVTLSWGLERSRESFTSGANWSVDDGKTTTRSAFGEALWAVTDQIDLSFALRYDEHDSFGAKTTGRIGAAWRPNENWVLRSVVSTGYRAPSLYQLYAANYGNPDLTPENSTSYELGAERVFARGSAQVTLFDTEIRDRIDYDYVTWSYAQVPGKTRVKGVELSSHYDLTPNWTVRANYTYSDATDPNGRVALVPRNSLNLGIDGTLAQVWHLGGGLGYNGDITDAKGNMPDYTLVNLSLARDLNDSTQAYVRIENLFDKDYQTVRNYDQPGRQIFVGLRATF